MLYGIRSLPHRFRLLLSSFQQDDNLSFSDVLTQEQIQSVCDQHDVASGDEDQVFTPSITIWGFLSQVIHKGEHRSCLAAVARIGVMLIAFGRPRCAQNNGPYCRARCRLPVADLRATHDGCGRELRSSSPRAIGCCIGRHVKLIDGSTVTMPDTEENQEAFPQQSCQKEGLGFPIARLVVVISLATAMVGGMSMGPYQGKETGELARLRELLDRFEAGDIALADKLYCAYFMIASAVGKRGGRGHAASSIAGCRCRGTSRQATWQRRLLDDVASP